MDPNELTELTAKLKDIAETLRQGDMPVPG